MGDFEKLRVCREFMGPLLSARERAVGIQAQHILRLRCILNPQKEAEGHSRRQGFRSAWGLGFRIGVYRVQGLGFRVPGLEIGV